MVVGGGWAVQSAVLCLKPLDSAALVPMHGGGWGWGRGRGGVGGWKVGVGNPHCVGACVRG